MHYPATYSVSNNRYTSPLQQASLALCLTYLLSIQSFRTIDELLDIDKDKLILSGSLARAMRVITNRDNSNNQSIICYWCSVWLLWPGWILRWFYSCAVSSWKKDHHIFNLSLSRSNNSLSLMICRWNNVCIIYIINWINIFIWRFLYEDFYFILFIILNIK